MHYEHRYQYDTDYLLLAKRINTSHPDCTDSDKFHMNMTSRSNQHVML